MRTCLVMLAALVVAACTHASHPPAKPAPVPVDQNVSLRGATTGKYLSAEQGGGGKLFVSRDEAKGWELFTIRDLDGGALESGDPVALLSASGRYVTVAANGTVDASG